jgi:ABC-type bacteriocin/lantibiotic exporter with double-glycine peptidase domain
VNTIFRNTWSILNGEEKKSFTILLILGVLISLADILSLITLLWVINFYIQPGMDNIASSLPAWLSDKNSINLIAAFFVVFSLKNLAAYWLAKSHYDFTGRVAIRVSRNNLLRFQYSTYHEFVHTDSSALIRQIALQPFEFSQYVLSGLQQIITQTVLITLAIIAIVIFNFKLFLLLLLILLPPVVVVFYFIKKRMTLVKKDLRESNERSYQYLLDALKGYVEGNLYQRSEFFLNRFLKFRRQFSSSLFSSLSLQNLPARIIEIFAVLGLFILLMIAKSSGDNDTSTLITIGAFMAAAYKIIPGIVKLINLVAQVKAYEFSAAELKTVLPPETPAPSIQPEPIDSLELRNISFEYEQKPVLMDISFTLKKGDILGIRGFSGKGKTTILNILLGFLEPSNGEVIVNGKIRSRDELKKYWPSICYVRQQPFLIYDTILRNITLEEVEFDKEKLGKALCISGLEDLIKTFPEGTNKVITENGKNISGGQQQRIAIARALYKDAPLFLLDEPFNELDENATQQLLLHFHQLSKDHMIILITHDSKSLSYCNKIMDLNEQG